MSLDHAEDAPEAPLDLPAAEAQVDDDAVYYEEQVEPEYGILGLTLRELIIVGAWAAAFVASFFPVLPGGDSVWALGIDWVLAIGVPTVAVFLIVLRRFSPQGIRRVGSLGIDQFASAAVSVSAVVWAGLIWKQVAVTVQTGAFLVGWVPIVAEIAMLVLVAVTVAAPLIPRLRDDFTGRMETLAHRAANPIRPVISRPRPEPAAAAEVPAAEESATEEAVDEEAEPLQTDAEAESTEAESTEDDQAESVAEGHPDAQTMVLADAVSAKEFSQWAVPTAHPVVAQEQAGPEDSALADAPTGWEKPAPVADTVSDAEARYDDATPDADATRVLDVIPAESLPTWSPAVESPVENPVESSVENPVESEPVTESIIPPRAVPETDEKPADEPQTDEQHADQRDAGIAYTDPIGALNEIFETKGTIEEPPLRRTLNEQARAAQAETAASPAPAVEHPADAPFWALARSERDVLDERGHPLFRIGPDAWVLVIEDRGGAYVVRHDDGRIGYLHDITDITKG